MGSSPRVRGKPYDGKTGRVKDGLIPARAGKTRALRRRSGLRRAHPRACGENPSAPSRSSPAGGSSPRVRGKPRVDINEATARGLIPARAGKTTATARREEELTAHPRACGENRPDGLSGGVAGGSSPRVRGKPRPPRERPQRPGLIPARAGKTMVTVALVGWPGAHPRACGENNT